MENEEIRYSIAKKQTLKIRYWMTKLLMQEKFMQFYPGSIFSSHFPPLPPRGKQTVKFTPPTISDVTD